MTKTNEPRGTRSAMAAHELIQTYEKAALQDAIVKMNAAISTVPGTGMNTDIRDSLGRKAFAALILAAKAREVWVCTKRSESFLLWLREAVAYAGEINDDLTENPELFEMYAGGAEAENAGGWLHDRQHEADTDAEQLLEERKAARDPRTGAYRDDRTDDELYDAWVDRTVLGL